MSFNRRSFLIGAGSGLSLLVLTACTVDGPTPTPAPTDIPQPGAPKPSAFHRSTWTTDAFSRGSHSFIAVGSSPDDRVTLRQPLENRVFFAGEATSSEASGTVRGARRSGARAATEIATLADEGETIAIVGAGAAGAEAARLLSSWQYDVVVVEARDRTGGRILTRDAKSALPVELGAWRLDPGADQEIVADLIALNVGTAELTSAVYHSSDAHTDGSTLGATALHDAAQWAASQLNDIPLDAALDESGAARTASGEGGDLDGAELLDQYLADLAARSGAEPSEISSWYGVSEPPAVELAVTGDFSAVVTAALEGVKTFLNTVVVGVAYDGKGVSLRLATGESLSVDRVVLTVPLGVLQDDGIAFDPLLPFGKRAAIAALGYGAAETVWMRFDEKFWTNDATVWNLVGTDAEITTWFNLEPATGENVLIGIVGGHAAAAVAALDDDELVTVARDSLRPFIGA